MTSALRRACVGLATLAVAIGALIAPTAASAAVPQPPRVGAPSHPLWRFMSPGFIPTTADCEAQLHIACYRPSQMQAAYGVDSLISGNLDGTGTTIAVVDAFGSPTIKRDLARFDTDFGLPAPPQFTILQPVGTVPPYHPTNDRFGWAFETTLDVEWAHAFAPGAKILLVETPATETEGLQGFPKIVQAENYVINHHLADVISQSFGASESTFPSHAAIQKLRSAYVNAQANDVTVLASSGDTGATGYALNSSLITHREAQWPASDPLVTAVGGTQLHLNAAGARKSVDTVWNDGFNHNVTGTSAPQAIAGGGGISSVFLRPAFQSGIHAFSANRRGYPDVSLSAAVNGGVLVYGSFRGLPGAGYFIVGGTSEASPEFAGIVAIADQAAGHDLGWLNPLLYTLHTDGSPALVDITKGNNTVKFIQAHKLHTVTGFVARPGFDLASGLGTIDAQALIAEVS